MKKIVIIGASGFLGRGLFDLFNKKDFKVIGTYHSRQTLHSFQRLDIRQTVKLNEFIKNHKPDFILWAAGNKSVNICEQDYKLAYNINTKPIEDLIGAMQCEGINSKLLYISTDYVFDGKKGGYRDATPPAPLTNYGKTMRLAEKAIENSQLDYKIIRTAAVMGRGGVFFEWLLASLLAKQKMHLFSNVYFSPTPKRMLVEFMGWFVSNYHKIGNKTLHVVGDAVMSRYDFARMIKNIDKDRFQAELIADRIDLSNTLFQKNLSLVQSDIVREYQKISLTDYMKDEITDDRDC